jgi:thiol-disulfide isomerase/thioredoxin
MNTLLVVLAFVLLGLLVYRFWKPMIQPPKREVKPNEANLYFFYTNWCGFSQKAMPEWTKLEEKLKRESYFGKTHVNAVAVDCEADRAMRTLYDIQGYPTVILETKTGLTEYTKQVTYSNLMTFLRESLGQERENL